MSRTKGSQGAQLETLLESSIEIALRQSSNFPKFFLLICVDLKGLKFIVEADLRYVEHLCRRTKILFFCSPTQVFDVP